MTNPLTKLFKTDSIANLSKALTARTRQEIEVLAIPPALATEAEIELDAALKAVAADPADRTARSRLAVAFPAAIFWRQNKGTAQNLLLALTEDADASELKALVARAAYELRAKLESEAAALAKSAEGYAAPHPGSVVIADALGRITALERRLTGQPGEIRAAAAELLSVAGAK